MWLARCGRRGGGWRGFDGLLGRGTRGQLPSLFRRKLLVLLPFLTHVFALLRRELLQGLVLFPGNPAFSGCKTRPCAHLLPDALLLLGGHAGITLRDAKPLLLALRVELVPFGG